MGNVLREHEKRNPHRIGIIIIIILLFVARYMNHEFKSHMRLVSIYYTPSSERLENFKL
jgi:hypothetical protein